MKHRLPTRRCPLMALLAIALIAGGCGTSAKSPTGPTTTDLTQSEANDVAVQTAFALDQVGLRRGGRGQRPAPRTRRCVRAPCPCGRPGHATLGSDGLNAESPAQLLRRGGQRPGRATAPPPSG